MLATGFLGGAKGRLLPASIPFRFFISAAVLHLVAWLVVLIFADDFPGFTGGLGPPLAALHLITLGVLAMTAMGAALQLLPVSTRQGIVAVWPAKLAYWLFMPGVVIFSGASVAYDPIGVAVGAGLAGAALSIFAVLIADNLRRARSLPLVAAHGWAAVMSLLVLLALGLGAAFDFAAPFLPDHQAVAGAHLVAAVFGFMGMLAVGFSYVLVPMFALSRSPSPYLAWTGFGLGCCALVAGIAGFFVDHVYLLAGAAIIGLWAATLYLAAMAQVMKKRMRKRLGRSFFLIRIAWVLLPVSLITALAVLIGEPIPDGPAIVVVLVLLGWQLTFVLGILQRIMPFLGSMHVSQQPGGQSLVSRFTDIWELKYSAYCHLTALVLLCIGLITEWPLIIRGAGLCGVVGAILFLRFAAAVTRAVFAHKADSNNGGGQRPNR